MSEVASSTYYSFLIEKCIIYMITYYIFKIMYTIDIIFIQLIYYFEKKWQQF